jgi:adenosylhomocysteine nucleosidase
MLWGVVGAVEEEVWPVIDNLTEKRETRRNGKSIYEGKIENSPVVVTATGVGKIRTAASVQYLIDHFPLDAVIFTGVAGAINPELSLGDIVICRKAVQHDFNIGGGTAQDRMKTPWFEADPELVRNALKVGDRLGLQVKVRTGVVLTGDRAVVDSETRTWLWQTFHGDCVEMEGAAVAMVCSLNNVPFLLIRAISDYADEAAREDFRTAMSQAAVGSATLVLGLLGQFDGIRAFRRTFLFRLRRFAARRMRSVIERFHRTPRQ